MKNERHDEPLRVISLGAGVQSSALLLMADAGEFDENPDCAIFADTGWEPRAVYEHLERLEQIVSTPIYRVSAGNIREDALASRHFASMPLYVRNLNGTKGQLRRQCTNEYKVQPIYRKLRELLGSGRPKSRSVELWLGISLDEAMRMKDARVKYVYNRWPLIERSMTRLDCLNWLERNGFSTPAKSACIGCPYHDRATWRRMKLDEPESFADAAAFDREVRQMTRIDGEAFLLRSLVALDDADLRSEEDAGQMALDLFGEECEGMCGV